MYIYIILLENEEYNIGHGKTIYTKKDGYWEEEPQLCIDEINQTIFKSKNKFSGSQFGCASMESDTVKDFYDILLGSFLDVNYDEYPFSELIKNGENEFFIRYN